VLDSLFLSFHSLITTRPENTGTDERGMEKC
jgi:hypothetical protein